MTHTKGPWAAYSDGKAEMNNINHFIRNLAGDLICYGHLSEADARRIVACVNACIGIDTELLEIVTDNDKTLSGVIASVEKQRDELKSSLEKFAAWNKRYPSSRIYSHDAIRVIAQELDQIASEAEAAISRSKGESPTTCPKCNTPDLCREYGRACNPYEIPETSVPAIIFYPAGSLGEPIDLERGTA